MKNKNFQEERFDSYLNKTIIYSSKWYFREYNKFTNIEKDVDDFDMSSIILNDAFFDSNSYTLDLIDNKLLLKDALNKLSDIEQTVIFLLFQQDLKQDDVANILEIYTRSVRRIEYRALKKLKNYLEGEK